tara:strand:- start:17236 stop:17643 length:408 start_codon:yes stop_codon:yes gene_type:complete
MAGYSGTPLFKKLGIQEGFRVRTIAAPDHYLELVDGLPIGVKISSRLRGEVDMYHIFTKRCEELPGLIQTAIQAIPSNGMIWVSWPKKSSKVISDMTEDEIRRVALPLGLVDVKVCAVDDVWSGLKLVMRKENRR